MSPIALAAACTLQLTLTEVRPAETGWTETVRLQVIADGDTCPWVDVALPPGVQLERWKGRLKLGDGTGRKLGDERVEVRPRTLDDRGSVRVHLPDLLSGDRLDLTLTRRWSEDTAYTWAPSPARHAELRAPRNLEWQLQGGVRLEDGKGLAWVGAPGPDDRVVLTEGPRQGPLRASTEGLLPAASAQEERRIELIVPEGDPQRTLFPGGGASTRTDVRLRFPPAEDRRGWLVPLPEARGEVAWTVQPPGAAEVVQRPDALVVVLEPTEGPTRVGLSWTSPDAPTFGERPAGVASYEVTAPGGHVVWEGDQWLLAAIHDKPVLPARSALLRALDHRFRGVSMPEPGVPNALRGMRTGWEAAGFIRDAVHERAVPGRWPADPLWPRKLVRARRSGTLSPVEGALITWLFARQLGLDAQWALVRPASDGPGAPTSPAGYTEALVRMQHAGETRWVDFGCAECGPFELRPELEGASALGPGIAGTPPPTPGSWTVEVGRQGVRWTLEGPAALDLRRWLREVPGAQHAPALAERMAGPGAELVQAEGLDQPGAPVTVAARLGSGAFVDPLELPVSREDGTVWVPWIGERRLVRPKEGEVAPAEVSAGPLTWRRDVQDEVVVETLTVRERLLSAEHLDEVERARREPPPAEPAEPAEPAGDPTTPPSP